MGLFAETELGEDLLVAVARTPFQVIQKGSAVRDQLEESTPRGMILLVDFQVFGQFVDALRKQRDLDIRASGVFFMEPQFFSSAFFQCCHLDFFNYER